MSKVLASFLRLAPIIGVCCIVCFATDLTGVVVDDQGKPVAGAAVAVGRSSVDGPLRAAETYSAVAAADGSYKLNSLGAGPWIVCASVQGRDLLDSCQWGAPSVVRFTGGSDNVAIKTQLQLGATVSIRIDDPGRLLSTAVPIGKPHPAIIMGVQPAGGLFHPALPVATDSTGQNFEVVVAPNMDLGFFIVPQNVTLSDAATHSLINSNQLINVNLPPGALLQLHYVASVGTLGSQNIP